MGCTTNKAEDVIGCLHCKFYCTKCNKRVYACTSSVSCIHCGTSSIHFCQTIHNKFNGPTLTKNHVSEKKKQEYDRCEWCHSSNEHKDNLLKIISDALQEIKKKEANKTSSQSHAKKITSGERHTSIINRLRKINNMLGYDDNVQMPISKSKSKSKQAEQKVPGGPDLITESEL